MEDESARFAGEIANLETVNTHLNQEIETQLETLT
jgi:hypothetical protein